MESLRYYIAHNGGLKVMQPEGSLMTTVGEFFQGKTLEHLIGCSQKPEVVFAAVAFDGGYRTEDAGKSWTKIMDGDVRTFTIDPHDERVVYMGIGPIRLFRSEDIGKTWEPLDGMLNVSDDVKKKWDVPPRLRGVEFPHVRHIFVHPDDQNLIWVLLEHGGNLLTRDCGKTWEDLLPGSIREASAPKPGVQLQATPQPNPIPTHNTNPRRIVRIATAPDRTRDPEERAARKPENRSAGNRTTVRDGSRN